MTSTLVAPSALRPPRNIVLIQPDEEGSEIKTSEEAKEAVFTVVNPKKKGLQVRSVRKIQGNGIAVETTTAEALKVFTENAKLKEAGLKAVTPEAKKPRLIIYDVPRDMSEKEILSSIRRQNGMDNISTEELEGEIKLRFKTGPKERNQTNWVAEVTPEMRRKLIDGKRLFIGWCACKVQDFVSVPRCYNCQGYGHISKHCKQDGETCGHCADRGHDIKACQRKEEPPNCVNCKKAGKPCGHSVTWKECPALKVALERQANRTQYE